MNKRYRNSCQYCRMKKCLRVGMKREGERKLQNRLFSFDHFIVLHDLRAVGKYGSELCLNLFSESSFAELIRTGPALK